MTALQRKIADGMENSLPNIEATKVYEVQHHLSLTGHSWDGLWILANAEAWSRIPAHMQAIVERHCDRAVVEQRRAFLAMEAASQERLKAALT